MVSGYFIISKWLRFIKASNKKTKKSNKDFWNTVKKRKKKKYWERDKLRIRLWSAFWTTQAFQESHVKSKQIYTGFYVIEV